MGPLREFGANIWTAEGPPVRAFGISLPTRMVVVRLADGALWIDSPVEASDDEIDALAALGPIRYLVAPTKLHVWRLVRWKARLPDAPSAQRARLPCRCRR